MVPPPFRSGEEWQACAHNHHLYCYSSVALHPTPPLFLNLQYTGLVVVASDRNVWMQM